MVELGFSQGLHLKIEGSEVMGESLGFGVEGLGCRAEGFGFRV